MCVLIRCNPRYSDQVDESEGETAVGLKKIVRVSANIVMARKRKRVGKSDPTWGISDDVLVRIVERLPEARSIVRCMAVCHRWRSVIRSSKRFLPHFRASILFRLERGPGPAHALFPDKPTVTTYEILQNAEILASACGGQLLLVSQGHDFYVGRDSDWTRLPGRSLPHSCGVGLVGNGNGNFAVVIVDGCRVGGKYFYFSARKFLSRTGKWEDVVSYKIGKKVNYFATVGFNDGRWESLARKDTQNKFRSGSLPPVACSDGLLHWLDGEGKGVISFDPFRGQSWFVDLPEWDRALNHKLGLGVVNGRVRLSSVLGCLLRVWEMVGERWALVHELMTTSPTWFLLAMHPVDGDVLFFASSIGEIFRLDVVRSHYDKLGHLSARRSFGSYIRVFPLVPNSS